MIRAYVFGVLLFTGLFCRAQPGTYRQYTTDNGLLSNTVYDVLQDNNGFIWIATLTGVQRFDGTHFQSFTREDGLPDSEILRINKDRFGRIWFLGYNGHIAYFEKERIIGPRDYPAWARFKFKSVPLHFFEGRNGNIHIIDQAGGHLKIQADAQGIRGIALAPERADYYWESGNKSYFIRDGKIYREGNPNVLLADFYKSISFWFGNGTFYFQTKDGIMGMRGDSIRRVMPWPEGLDPATRYLVYGNRMVFLESEKGPIVYTRTAEGWRPGNIYEGAVNAGKFFYDADGEVWVASLTEGLYHFPAWGRKYRSAERNPGWPGKTVTEMRVTDDNRILAGFDNNSIAVFDTRLTLLGSNRTLKKNVYHPVRDIEKWQDDVYLVGGSTGGYITRIPLRTHKPELTAFTHWAVKTVTTAPSGDIYFTTRNHIAIYRPKERRIVFKLSGAFDSRKYTVLPVSDAGDFLYSDSGGLHYYSVEEGEKKLPGHPFFSNRIIEILPVSGSRFILVTDGQGIALVDGITRQMDIIPEHALRNGILRKARLYNNRLWVAGSKGIGIFEVRNTRLRLQHWLDESRGLLSPDVFSFCVKDSFLYVFTPRGFQKMDVESLSREKRLPRLFIHRLESGTRQWLLPEGRVNLPADCKEITLQCAALSLEDPSKTVFAYRFEGASRYIESDQARLSIPIEWQGEKTLYVRCRKGEGRWTADTALLLAVPVPLHQKGWVQLLVYLCITTGTVWLSLRIANRIKERQRREKEMKLQIAQLEIKSLQALMNPHFIFNTLNSIQYFINENDAYNSNKYLTLFARLIRGNLHSNREPLMPLQRELEYLTHYIELEKLRFGKRLHFHLTVDENINAEQVLIPGMLIQPLLENAIKHGIVGSKSQGTINMHISRESEYLKIKIKDNGRGLGRSDNPTQATAHKSLGLEMIRERLAVLSELYGKPFMFELRDNPDSTTGAVAILRLPLLVK